MRPTYLSPGWGLSFGKAQLGPSGCEPHIVLFDGPHHRDRQRSLKNEEREQCCGNDARPA
jgi:hypothetical protein